MEPQVAEPTAVLPHPAGAEPVPAPAAPRLARHPRYDYWLLVGSHALMDVLPMFIVSLMIVLADRLALTRAQETVVWVVGPIFSGGIQPLFAWLGDRYDTRLAGPVGLGVAAACIGSIGLAHSFEQLVALQVVGVIGIGIYHPTAAAVAGQTGPAALKRGRAFALSVFVASGMVGHTLGPIAATRVNEAFGMAYLAWIIPPALIVCVLLHLATRDAPHRPHNHHELRAALTAVEARARWYAAVLLSAQNSLRFTVNTGMFILFSYWAASRIPGDANAAAVLNGNLIAAMTVGMGLGAVLGGLVFRQGAERGTFAATAFGGAVFVALINAAAGWGLGLAPAYLAAALAAMGFFSTIPPAMSLGQRLLPSHTGLVTSLLLGVAWMFGALARPISSALLGNSRLEEAVALTDVTLNRAFGGFAVLLALAGVLALMMPSKTVRDVARHA